MAVWEGWEASEAKMPEKVTCGARCPVVGYVSRRRPMRWLWIASWWYPGGQNGVLAGIFPSGRVVQQLYP
jgi:hypothetical protein